LSSPFLNLDTISYQYPQSDWLLALDFLDIAPGKLLGIIGPNGAGKSTLLKIAAGTLKPDSGHITLMGQSIHQISRKCVAKKLGYLPQKNQSLYDYRVEEIVQMGRYPHLEGAGFLMPKDIEIVNDCLTKTDTISIRNRRMSQLSGGQQQRVFLASTLAQEPKVLLLDEPTAGLDLYHQTEFFRQLRALASHEIAIAVVTHDFNLASIYCDHILLMSDGVAVQDGSVEDVINKDVLEPIFQDTIQIIMHPQTNRPVILPASFKDIQ